MQAEAINPDRRSVWLSAKRNTTTQAAIRSSKGALDFGGKIITDKDAVFVESIRVDKGASSAGA